MKRTEPQWIPNPFKAAVYVRVSAGEQARNASPLDEQIERILAYLRAVRLDCAEIFRDERVPGCRPLHRRPAAARMLRMIRGGEVSHVVALRLDRLFGSAEEAVDTSLGWKRQGVSLHLLDVAGQVLNTGFAIGEMMLSVICAVCEMEYMANADRPAGARDRRERRNVYGPTPYGFQRGGSELTRSMQARGQTETRSGESGTELVPENTEREVLEHMKKVRAEGLSLRAIATILNEKKVPCKRGGARWYASTVGSILRNNISSPEEPGSE